MNAPVLADWKKIGKPKAEIVVCPPYIYLKDLKTKKLKHVKIGAQNCFWGNSGAYTGEVSPAMLKNSGAEYVIIGHSERRKYFCETDEMANKKVLAAQRARLKVVLCVGERKKGIKEAKGFIKKQLEKDLKGAVKNIIIAYEPVWAIGDGDSATPEYALEIIKFIGNFLSSKFHASSCKVLYGGSVDGKNAADFVKYKEIDGVLVGGASLNPNEVKKIIEKVG